jgi:hypothetical protein
VKTDCSLMLHPSWEKLEGKKKTSVSIVLEMAFTKQRKWVINDQSSQELCANAKPFFCDSNMMNFNFIQKKNVFVFVHTQD